MGVNEPENAVRRVDATAFPAYNIRMETTFVRWLVNTIALLLAVRFVPGIIYSGEWWGMLIVGLLFGLVNTYLRPLVRFLTFPLLILSLGMFTFILNAMMLSFTSWVSVKLGLGFHVDGFWPAFWGALVISVASLVISCALPPQEEKTQSA